jgi:hypothetical protein
MAPDGEDSEFARMRCSRTHHALSFGVEVPVRTASCIAALDDIARRAVR